MKNWKEADLSKMMHIKHGYAFKGEYFVPEGDYMVLTPGNFYESGGFRIRDGKEKFYSGEIPQSYVLQKNDLIVAMTEQGEGLLGSAALIPESNKYLHNQRLGLVELNPDLLEKKFIYYLFNTSWIRQQIRNSSSGTKVRHTSPERIYKVKVQIPLLETQKKIAAVLSAYDDLIENNDRRIALLEKMAEEIYREWFVRFRFPGWQNTEFEKGIPKDWKCDRFDSFCLLKRGYDLPNSQVQPGSFPVVASTSIKTYHNTYKVNPPVTTTGRSGSLGTVLFTTEKAWPLNTTLYVKDFKENNPYLVYYVLKNMKLESFNSGAGVPTLNRNHLNSLKINIPSRGIQNKFNSYIEPIFKTKQRLNSINTTLENTKNELIPRLISGKLSVEELDIAFPSSMQETIQK